MKKHINILMAVLFIGTSAIAQIDRSKIPTSGPTPEINLGEPDTFDLDNGLEVLVVTDRKLPTITMSLDLNNPPIVEGDKTGVQSLTGSIMGKGTTKTPKEKFNEEVDYLGARISVGTGGGYVSTLSKYTDKVMGLFAEAALNPNFTQEELETEKSQLIEGIKSGENSAAAIAGTVRNALAYGKNHAAGEFATEESINNVTLADVKKFYSDYFVPNNAYLLISGDIDKKEAKKLVEKYFKDWKAKEAPKANLPEVTDVSTTEIDFIDVPNAVQTELAVINTSELKMKDEDYHAALVANYIFGGGFGSYLNMNLREKNGYTYGAGSGLGAGRDYKSTFRATTKVRNEVTDSAVVETFKELDRIKTTFVSDEDLSNAKAKFLGSFIMQSEDKSVVADRAITIRTNDLDEDFYKDFIANINAVTKEDVKRVANKYFKTDNMRVVLVGKASDVLENLEAMKVNGKTLPIKFYDKEANPTERPSTISVPEGTTVNTVFADYIKAIGGRDNVAAVKSTALIGSASSPMGEIVLNVKKTNDNKFSQTVTVGGNVVSKQVYANGKGKVGGMQGNAELEGEQLAAVADEAVLFPEYTFPDQGELVGAEKMGDQTVYVIKWSDTKKTFYDMNSGLLVGQENTVKAQGQEFKTLIKYDNYKEVKGVKYPMTIIQQMAGRDMRFDINTVRVNEGVVDADFE
ncbi:Predicted Zn-dependent peptidase [Nonlabens sp. Hel1_33_55]|uniref:M16 family metallopeptidase n=1 Tax=Nonlabens sp. Hel1_33_55 TaxID=1336802 RepID=UPI000875BCD2|nr:pitrilysin family protein [Nonlabens sp. Hel1_33_55]SCY36024.1 Predicted Zn-dependent peptidase [Nonlabens sp. Hel1_33_55]